MSKLGVVARTRLYLLGCACCSFLATLAVRPPSFEVFSLTASPTLSPNHHSTPLSFVVWPHLIGLKSGDVLAVRAQGVLFCCLLSLVIRPHPLSSTRHATRPNDLNACSERPSKWPGGEQSRLLINAGQEQC